MAHHLLVVLPLFLLSITLHEFGHALVARAMGDPTAQNAGRVTLNPLKHLDPLGTLMILFGPIGWAKPVPIDESRLGRWGTVLVGLAGPLANVFLAAIAISCLKHPGALLAISGLEPEWLYPLKILFELNCALAVFNLLPIPPLDGSQIFRGLLPPELRPGYYQILPFGIVILLFLVTFPVGDHVLGSILDFTESLLVRSVP